MSKPFDDAWAWLKSQLGDKASMLIALGAFALFGLGWARSEVRAAAHEETEPLRLEQERQRKVMERYEGDVHEFGKDLRELYRVSPVIRRSDRLEMPFPEHDAGEP